MNRLFSTLVLMLGGVLSGTGFAHDFGAGLENTTWNLEPNPLFCRLWQPVPNYGKVGFETLAGEEPHFYVETQRPAVKKGAAQIRIVAPYWRPGIKPKELGTVSSNKGKRPINLGKKWANRFIDELQVGLSPSLELKGWHDRHNLEIDVSAVNFQDAYNGYISCLSSLFPANFNQLQNTTLYYDTNKWGLTKAAQERLDLIVGYVQLDPEIKKITIHGHADSVGRKGHNWEISRLRAKRVMDYLVDKGIDPEMITMNYWGEGRPFRKNSSSRNKAYNRRVYIHMSKKG